MEVYWQILLVEGCFDVAKLIEAGILNAGACFGAHLDEKQLPRLADIAAGTGSIAMPPDSGVRHRPWR